MDWMYNLFPLFFGATFLIVIVGFISTFVKGVRQWNKNNHSPRLTVPVQVVAKRADVDSHHHHDEDHVSYTNYSTTYYATFQVESGDRMEFTLSGGDYGMMVEGDRGNLTFQGTRFLGFERT